MPMRDCAILRKEKYIQVTLTCSQAAAWRTSPFSRSHGYELSSSRVQKEANSAGCEPAASEERQYLAACTAWPSSKDKDK